MSVKRLSKFLQNEELDPDVIDWTPELDNSGLLLLLLLLLLTITLLYIAHNDVALNVKSASFSWDTEKQDIPTLIK